MFLSLLGSNFSQKYWYWYWGIGLWASIGIGIGIDSEGNLSIGIGISIDLRLSASIGIGIGIDLWGDVSIGIGIGIDLSQFLVLVLVLTFEKWYCRCLLWTLPKLKDVKKVELKKFRIHTENKKNLIPSRELILC